jgi:cytochrome c oxidase subunit IV
LTRKIGASPSVGGAAFLFVGSQLSPLVDAVSVIVWVFILFYKLFDTIYPVLLCLSDTAFQIDLFRAFQGFGRIMLNHIRMMLFAISHNFE